MKTRSPRSLFAAALLFLPSVTPAVPPAGKTPAAPPSTGKLDVRILVTAEPEKVLHPTKGADGKYDMAEPVKVAPRGKKVYGLVFFKDCKADATGNCNVDIDLQGMVPGGQLFENRRGAELWKKKAPHAGFTQLGTPKMTIQIEDRDPAGTYRVVAVAHDRVAGTEARSEATFEVK